MVSKPDVKKSQNHYMSSYYTVIYSVYACVYIYIYVHSIEIHEDTTIAGPGA